MDIMIGYYVLMMTLGVNLNTRILINVNMTNIAISNYVNINTQHKMTI